MCTVGAHAAPPGAEGGTGALGCHLSTLWSPPVPSRSGHHGGSAAPAPLTSAPLPPSLSHTNHRVRMAEADHAPQKVSRTPFITTIVEFCISGTRRDPGDHLAPSPQRRDVPFAKTVPGLSRTLLSVGVPTTPPSAQVGVPLSTPEAGWLRPARSTPHHRPRQGRWHQESQETERPYLSSWAPVMVTCPPGQAAPGRGSGPLSLKLRMRSTAAGGPRPPERARELLGGDARLSPLPGGSGWSQGRRPARGGPGGRLLLRSQPPQLLSPSPSPRLASPLCRGPGKDACVRRRLTRAPGRPALPGSLWPAPGLINTNLQANTGPPSC